MADTYKIKEQQGIYFVTFTVHQWVDVFTRSEYKNILIDSLKFCQTNKGLKIFSWVIMTNHIHLIIKSDEHNLSDIIRDFKKFTATKVIQTIENNDRESRKKWLLWLLKNGDDIVFWKEGYYGEEIRTLEFYKTKEQYIHLNPVRSGLVEKEEHYLYSSCSECYGMGKSLIQLNFFNMRKNIKNVYLSIQQDALRNILLSVDKIGLTGRNGNAGIQSNGQYASNHPHLHLQIDAMGDNNPIQFLNTKFDVFGNKLKK